MAKKFVLKITLFVALFFTGLGTLSACSCSGEEYFCHEIIDTSDVYLHPDYIFKGIKLQDTLHGMFVKIERQYINEIIEDTVLIWGDPGHLCRVYTSNFHIGDTIILGINKLEFESGMPEESIGDYWLPACGVTFLKIENGIVLGPISEGLNSMFLEDFEFYMENEVYKTECSVTNIEYQNQFDQNNIIVFPNPTQKAAFISCENCDFIDDLAVFNVNGQLQNVQFVKEEKLIRLDLEGLENGVFFIQLSSQKNFQTFKLLVM